MRIKNCYLYVTILFILLIINDSQAQNRAQKPNIIFIVSDDLNCRIGCYGDPVAQTPNIDQLAKRGVVFNKAYCQFPVCNPSRSSILSGRYPTETKVLDNNTLLILDDNYVTLPEYFLSNNYNVSVLGKIFHDKNTGFKISSIPKIERYFTPDEREAQKLKEDYWSNNHCPYRNFTLKDPSIYAWANDFGPLNTDFDFQSQNGGSTKQDIITTNNAIDAIGDFAKQKKPFFIAVGYHKPHVPLKVPQKYFNLYNSDTIPLPPDFNNEPKIIKGFPSLEFRQNIDLFAARSFTANEAREAIRAYYACVSFVDEQIGIILNELDRKNLINNTIIVLSSDHGWHLSEKGLWAKGTLFEESLHAPLIIVDPRTKSSGKKCQRVVQYIDIFPTLLDLCGYTDSNDQLEGRSLQPLLKNSNKKWNYPAYSFQTRGWMVGRSIITENWHYTKWDNGECALFNVNKDPNEMINLISDTFYNDVVSQCERLLDISKIK